MAKKNTKAKKETEVVEEVVETVVNEEVTTVVDDDIVEEVAEIIEEPMVKEEEPKADEVVEGSKEETVAIEELITTVDTKKATKQVKRNVADEDELLTITPLKPFNPKTAPRKRVKMKFEGWNGTYID